MADKNTYKVFIQFKNGKSLEFIIETDSDLRKTFAEETQFDKIFVGDYIIDKEEILWSRIQGDKVEENDA